MVIGHFTITDRHEHYWKCGIKMESVVVFSQFAFKCLFSSVVEHWSRKPGVDGSNPSGGIWLDIKFFFFANFFLIVSSTIDILLNEFGPATITYLFFILSFRYSNLKYDFIDSNWRMNEWFVIRKRMILTFPIFGNEFHWIWWLSLQFILQKNYLHILWATCCLYVLFWRIFLFGKLLWFNHEKLSLKSNRLSELLLLTHASRAKMNQSQDYNLFVHCVLIHNTW